MKFKADLPINFDNVFQTADEDRGIRLELNPTLGAVLAVSSFRNEERVKIFQILKTIEVKRVYDFSMTLDPNGELVVTIDGITVLKQTLKNKYRIEVSNFTLGAGFSNSRFLMGQIEEPKIFLKYNHSALSTIAYFKPYLGAFILWLLIFSLLVDIRFLPETLHPFQILQNSIGNKKAVFGVVLAGLIILLGVFFLLLENKYLNKFGWLYIGLAIFCFWLSEERSYFTLKQYHDKIFNACELFIDKLLLSFQKIYWSLVLLSTLTIFLTILYFPNFLSASITLLLFVYIGILSPKTRKLLDLADELFLNKLSTFVIIFAIALFISVSYYYTIKIPYWDDFLHSLNIFQVAGESSLLFSIKYCFTRFAEHITAGLNLLFIAVQSISGSIDFDYFFTLGSLFIIGFWGALFFSIKNCTLRGIALLPATLMLFQFQYYQINIWATNFCGVFLFQLSSFSSIFFLNKYLESEKTWMYWLSISLALFSTFTFGSGFLLLLLLFTHLLINGKPKLAAIWVLPMSLSIFLYFSSFINLVQVNIPMTHYLAFFLDFIGSIFTGGIFSKINDPLSFDQGLLFAKIGGLIVLLMFAGVTLKGLHRKNPTIYTFPIFLFANAVLATRQRAYIGEAQAFQSRYHLYSALILTLISIGMFEVWPQKRKALLALLGSLGIWISVNSILIGIPAMDRHSNNLLYGLYLSHFVKPANIGYEYQLESNAFFAGNMPKFDEYLREGVFKIPFSQLRNRLASARINTSNIQFMKLNVAQSIRVLKNEAFLEIIFIPTTPAQGIRQTTYQVLIATDDSSATYESRPIANINANTNLLKHYYDIKQDYQTLIPVEDLPRKSFKINILRNQNGALNGMTYNYE